METKILVDLGSYNLMNDQRLLIPFLRNDKIGFMNNKGEIIIDKIRIDLWESGAELAERVGVSHEFIRRNESKKGKKSFSVDTVWKISLALDIEPGKLFEIDMDELINQ